MRSVLFFAAALGSATALTLGCTTATDPDAGGADAGPHDAGPRADAGPYDAGDPFATDASCGRAVIEADRLPGSVLFAFDRSGSMDVPPGGPGPGPSRWDVAGGAVLSVLDALPDEANVGMLLFPVPALGMCNVVPGPGVPQVPVGPLASQRAPIRAELATVPDGPATPIFAALRAGWAHLDALGARGERALVLVTDGRESCDDGARAGVFAEATAAREDRGHLTFVVGLTQSHSDLSTLAFNGGTARTATCLPECTTPACVLDSDDPCPHNGAACATFPDGEGGALVGFCGCTAPSDCPAPTTCAPDGSGAMTCQGAPDCCHYDAAGPTFEADFRAALDAVVARVLDPCVFDLPRGDDPARFDPGQVNVRVTLPSRDASVLGRSSDPSVDSWDYVDAAQDAIEITGPICEALREGGTVEIVLGCPTVLI